jgi:hypothetical protein
MPQQGHLHDDRDVEQILKLAVNRAGYSDEEALRQRLMAAASELGLSDEQVRAAEEEYRIRKQEAAELAEYKAQAKKEFIEHLAGYLIVNAGLLGFNLYQSGGIGWAIWPIIGWGIGLAFHALEALHSGSGSFQEEFGAWRRKRRRREKRRQRREAEEG